MLLKRFLKHSKRYTILKWWLFLLITPGLIGCGAASQSVQKPTPCRPDSGNANVYLSTPHPWTSDIYRYSNMAILPPTLEQNNSQNSISDGAYLIPVTGQASQLDQAKYAALMFLISKIKRWTDIKSVKLDNSSEVSVIITFIHPELIQAVYLNDILKNPHPISNIEEEIQGILQKVSNRDELLFLITVTSSNQYVPNAAQHTVDIPIGQMVLMNAEDLPVTPLHDDHNLDQPIDLSQKPVFGVLGYPIGVQDGGRCKWVLDLTYNTNIVITVESMTVDNLPTGPLTWTIRYEPLVDTGVPLGTPDFALPTNYDINVFSTLEMPPGNISDANFWRDYARFVWREIAPGK